MLNIKDKLLTGDINITSFETIVELTADVECTYQGVLHLTDGTNITFDFIKYDEYYKSRIVLQKNDLYHLTGATIKVLMVSGELSEYTNYISTQCNTAKIAASITQCREEEVEKLNRKVATIEDTIALLKKNGKLNGINIINASQVAAGMIPVATINGDFILCYPFAEHVNEVNGLRPLQGKIVLNAGDIEYYNGQTIKEALASHVNAIKTLTETVASLSEEVKTIKNDLADLTIVVEQLNTYGTI